jgi:hypothetical protein
MDTITFLLAVIGGLLLFVALLGFGRSYTPPAPTYIVVPARNEPNWGCGTLIVPILLIVAAFAAIGYLGLLPAL